MNIECFCKHGREDEPVDKIVIAANRKMLIKMRCGCTVELQAKMAREGSTPHLPHRHEE